MLLRDRSQWSNSANAGVGEYDIDTPLHLDGVVKPIQVGQFGNVSLNAGHVAPDGLHSLVEFLLATARDKDIRTLS